MISILISNAALSAPGRVSDVPLNVSTLPKPNVLFVIDDSGSMENEVLLRKSAKAIYKGKLNGNGKDSTRADTGNLDMTPDTDSEYLELCVGYNVLAYDPKKTYRPWPGRNNIDISGADPKAPAYPQGWDHNGSSISTGDTGKGNKYKTNRTGNPNLNSKNGGDVPGGKAKLRLMKGNVGYLTWNDQNNKGEFDDGECGLDPNKGNNTKDLNKDGYIKFKDMGDSEKQNFANWYSYHRKRRFLITSPLLNVADTDGLRVGLATINIEKDSAGRPVADSARPVKDLTKSDNRKQLKNAILSLGSPKSTPLRKPLQNAGFYYQGLPYDPGFVGKDQAPSPILSEAEGGACQQNYTMLMTDGLSVEKDSTGANDITVGNADGDKNSKFDGTKEGKKYGDEYENTLGDIAMHFYETDLSKLPNKVSSGDKKDKNKQQHMVTYTVAFGVEGNLSWPIQGDNPMWPKTTLKNGNSIWFLQNERSLDDLMHAAFNGRGEFLSAVDGEQLNASIAKVVSDITSNASASGSAVSFSSDDIGEDTLLFESTYSTEFWSGDLRAFDFADGVKPVCPTNKRLSCPEDKNNAAACDVKCEISPVRYSAAKELTKKLKDPAIGPARRTVISYNGTKGVPFVFPANYAAPGAGELSPAQIEDLLLKAGADDKQTYGVNIVNYLRGDTTLEADPTKAAQQVNRFRYRGGHSLGDLNESTPQFVGSPSADYPNLIEGAGHPYNKFVSQYSKRTEMVYVGGNDGMLHGFDAGTGEELLAYIPGQLFSTNPKAGLHYLADPNYTHKSFVDGTPTIADVFVNGNWRTYLVGTYGVGGAGVYVLDVTDPSKFSEANAADIVKFEFNHDQLGLGFSRPQVVKMNDNRWAAVFGNGYNGENADGNARLFILYLDKSNNFNNFTEAGIKKDVAIIDTGRGNNNGNNCLKNNSDCNSLSTPAAVDFNRDSKADRIYAGDLLGNMWAFDVSNPNPDDWDVVHKNGKNKPLPMFVACRGALNNNSFCKREDRQPITTKPSIKGQRHVRTTSTRPNMLVVFGTGQYLSIDDTKDVLPMSANKVQSVYGVWDAGSSHANISREDLVQQTFVNAAREDRLLSQNKVDYTTVGADPVFGWYFDLPEKGERVTVAPRISNDIVLVTSSIPSSDECGGSGKGFLIGADIFSGGRTNFNIFGDDAKSAVEVGGTSGNGKGSVEGVTILDDAAQIGGSGGAGSVDFRDSEGSKSRRVNWSIIR